MHYNLGAVVHHGQAVVALQHTARAAHLGALRISEVALLLVAAWSLLLLVGLQKILEIGNFAAIVLGLSFGVQRGLGALLEQVALAVALNDAFSDTLKLPALGFELLMGAAPLLGGVRGQLAPVYREVLFTDQAELGGVQQHVTEQTDDLAIKLADEGCQRREMGPSIGRNGINT